MKRIILIIILLLVLSGCATWSKMGGEYTDRARGFKADLPNGWMSFNFAEYFVITKNGMILEQIAVEKNKIDKKLEYTKKKFTADMTAQDIAEVEIDNLRSNDDITDLEIEVNQAANISGINGFGFLATFKIAGKLKRKMIHYGFMYEDHIYRIIYNACEQHYFDTYLKDFMKFMKTFRLIDHDQPSDEKTFIVVK